MAAQLTCPHCRQILDFDHPVPTGVKVRCSACKRPFVNAGRTAVGGDAVPVAAPFVPPPGHATGPPRKGSAAIVLGVAAGIAVTVAVVVALVFFAHAPEAPSPGEEKVAQAPPNEEPPPELPEPKPAPPAETKKPAPAPEPKKDPPAEVKKAPAPTPPPTPSAVPPEMRKQINLAIERGAAFLRDPQTRATAWKFEREHSLGYTALTALTLLECDVPKDDPFIRKAAAEVRTGAVQAMKTYDVSLAVLLLDKLGDHEDEKMIQWLAMRLVACQNAAGGWSYECVPGDEAAAQELLAFLKEERAFRQKRLERPADQSGRAPVVPARFQNLAAFASEPAGQSPSNIIQFGDNSNTQFAMLALWAARRHGVPLERSFALAEKRFRRTQNADGGWGYAPIPTGPAPSTKSMTCVGLLGLAIGRGSEYEQLHLGKAASGAAVQKLADQDAGIQKGLKELGRHVGTPTGRTTGLALENLYFLWSVERVGVLYGLPTIGGKDWYRWGAELLLANQQANGCWAEKRFNPQTDSAVDTCFALLFLKRANLAPDLARHLRLYVPVVDPDRRSSGAP